MPAIEENYDVVVVGAGHAGCEQHWHVQGLDWKQLFLRSAWTVLR